MFPSHDAALLEGAKKLASTLADGKIGPRVVGIAFLGAIVKGYYDKEADIDIGVFYDRIEGKYNESETVTESGYQVHWHTMEYEKELQGAWDMTKRWAYSQIILHYDPKKELDRLIRLKVPLRKEERIRLLMESYALAEWYCNGLSRLWIDRGDEVSAHCMLSEGIDMFYRALFLLNDRLIPAKKWQHHCARSLGRLPAKFPERIHEVLLVRETSAREAERRRQAFLEIWGDLKNDVEGIIGEKFEVFKDLV